MLHRLYISAMVLALIFGGLVVVGTQVIWWHDHEIYEKEMRRDCIDKIVLYKDGKTYVATIEQSRQAILYGQCGFQTNEDGKVVMLDPSGRAYNAPKDDVAEGYRRGFRLETGAERCEREVNESTWVFKARELSDYEQMTLFAWSLLALVPAAILKGLREWLAWLAGKKKPGAQDQAKS